MENWKLNLENEVNLTKGLGLIKTKNLPLEYPQKKHKNNATLQ